MMTHPEILRDLAALKAAVEAHAVNLAEVRQQLDSVLRIGGPTPRRIPIAGFAPRVGVGLDAIRKAARAGRIIPIGDELWRPIRIGSRLHYERLEQHESISARDAP